MLPKQIDVAQRPRSALGKAAESEFVIAKILEGLMCKARFAWVIRICSEAQQNLLIDAHLLIFTCLLRQAPDVVNSEISGRIEFSSFHLDDAGHVAVLATMPAAPVDACCERNVISGLPGRRVDDCAARQPNCGATVG